MPGSLCCPVRYAPTLFLDIIITYPTNKEGQTLYVGPYLAGSLYLAKRQANLGTTTSYGRSTKTPHHRQPSPGSQTRYISAVLICCARLTGVRGGQEVRHGHSIVRQSHAMWCPAISVYVKA